MAIVGFHSHGDETMNDIYLHSSKCVIFASAVIHTVTDGVVGEIVWQLSIAKSSISCSIITTNVLVTEDIWI